ncbi:YwpF family protein [Virgibacillus soli]|uniref:YwpF family protein n=1 Tax=Paracerasibacillus soli TaxID=480284 RepID=A0ABU5CRH3_9BACI|nr:YwpF family protein [Virgibacillus soli]MDY0408038.1 YwpF family protein [Virgibacillus soli]
MKTFKLKSLVVKQAIDEELVYDKIQLMDGLIINREDEKNRWVIEAFIDKKYRDLFERLQREREEIMLEAKITKDTNEPATFITEINSINDIGNHINIIFIGTIIDVRKSKIEALLSQLIDEGYQGEVLLNKFKELI